MKKISQAFIIFLLLFSSIPVLQVTSNHLSTSSNVSQIDKPANKVQLLTEKIASRVDANGDKISDFYPTDENTVSSLIMFDDFSKVPMNNLFQGLNILKHFSSLPVIEVNLPRNELYQITKLPGIALIEENSKLKENLVRSTSQLGVRDYIWGQGYTGSSQNSIAIVDSGIDFTHQAFKDRIIASYNVLTSNATLAADDDGHGTHVAGIAAGATELQNNVVVETTRGKLPDQPCDTVSSCSFLPEFLVPLSGGATTDFTIEIDWAKKGVDNPGTSAGVVVIDADTARLACDNCLVKDNSGKFSHTFSLPAAPYIVGTVADQNALSSQFEATVSYPLSDPINDGRPAAAGVAYQNNLVIVKVVDAQGNGDVSTFQDAVTWLLNKRDTYNITVVNLSIGIESVSSIFDNLISDLADAGILAVVAAGNDGPSAQGVPSPGSAPEALTVGAVNPINELTYYSSMGTTKFNPVVHKPDVLAPGGSSASKLFGFSTDNPLGFRRILSADASLLFNLASNDLTSYEGTSMASPHIAGLAALLIQYLQENGQWTGTRADIMKVKRAILSGTFEVANIGVGREAEPNKNYDQYKPVLNHYAKDYQEGWGAVDARGAFDLLSQEIVIGDSINLQMSYTDPFARKVSGWTLHAEAGTNYGFLLNVPSNVDADILVVPANSGPLLNGKDYGDLSLSSYSFSGVGQDEYIGLSVDTTQDYFVIVRMADGPATQVNLTLTVSEENDLPHLSISSPVQGQTYDAGSVNVEYVINSGTVEGYLDGVSIGAIASGDKLNNLVGGEHTLQLINTLNGIKIERHVTFTIKSSFVNPNPNPINFAGITTLGISLFLISIIVVKNRKKRRV